MDKIHQHSHSTTRFTVIFLLRLMLSITGQVLYYSGGWYILEQYSVPVSIWVNVAYTIVGVVLLCLAQV
jgi:hypothetical protein